MGPQPDTRQLQTKPVHDQAAFTAPSLTDSADRDAECRGVLQSCQDRHADHRRHILPLAWNSGQATGSDRGPCPDAEPSLRPGASPPRVDLSDHLNLVSVDFIGGDGAEGSITCLKDDDRDHERGGEGGGGGGGILAGHLFWSCLWGGGGGPPDDGSLLSR